MIVEYSQLPSLIRPCLTPHEHHDWTITYGERETLSHIDGYMIVYGQGCKITLRASLTAAQKQLAVNDLLHQLVQIAQPGRQIILWSIADTLRSISG